MRRRTIVTIVCLLGVSIGTTWGQDGSSTINQADGQAAATAIVQPLSPNAMEALVAGIAFYPDALIEQILDAAQYPDAIKAASRSHAHTSTASPSWPASVQTLCASSEILQQLDQNAVVTARLALAARTQLADLWRAVDRVRVAFEEQQADQVNGASSQSVGAVSQIYPTAAFIAGYWTAQVVDEMQMWYQATTTSAVVYGQGVHGYGVYGQAAATVVGPAGNSAAVAGTGAAGHVRVGDTTYFGAAGTGTVTTSNGVQVQGQGNVTGSATQTTNGGSYQTDASGSASSNTGQSGSAQHNAQGGYAVNPDGSVDFNRNSQTNTSSTAGTSNIQHSGSGTYTGQGTGSYQGSTTVQSTHGDASITTSASDGQVSSTVTTAQGQQTATSGDGQPSNRRATATGQATSSTRRMARPETVPGAQSRFSHATAAQWKPAGQAMAGAWSRTKPTTGGPHRSSLNPTWSHHATSPTSRQGEFGRPGAKGPSGSKHKLAQPHRVKPNGVKSSPLKSLTVPQPSSRSRTVTPSRSGGGRSGGGRSGGGRSGGGRSGGRRGRR